MEMSKLKNILEAILLAAERTLTVIQLEALFELDEERPTRDEIRKALHEMAADYETRGYQLKQVASGFRLQVRQEYAAWVARLWEEKPARYTRALLETVALIAYRQPITRGEIEEVRGVSVSSNIIKTLLERDWVKVLGHKDVPGKPALYGTTKEFLDYFNLKTLDQLPTLAEIKDLDSIHPELALDEDMVEPSSDDSDVDNKESDDGIDNADAADNSFESDVTNKDETDEGESYEDEANEDEELPVEENSDDISSISIEANEEQDTTEEDSNDTEPEEPVVETSTIEQAEVTKNETEADESSADDSNEGSRSAFNA